MMTKRSNHMPTFTAIATNSSSHGDCRTRRDHSACGATTLQPIIVQYAHAYGPNARLMKTKRSVGLPEYQAMKNSIA